MDATAVGRVRSKGIVPTRSGLRIFQARSPFHGAPPSVINATILITPSPLAGGGLAAATRWTVWPRAAARFSASVRYASVAAARAAGKGVLIKKGLQSGHAAAGGGVPAALRYIFAQPGVSSVIVGTINPEHLRQNVEAALTALAGPG